MQVLYEQETGNTMQSMVKMSKWTMPNEKFSLQLPESFVQMNEVGQKENYPYRNRPEIILEERNSGVQITFQILDKEMKRADTEEAAAQMREQVKKAFPKYQCSIPYMLIAGELPVGWFVLEMEDRKKEHIKAIFSIENKLVLFTVTYWSREKEKWYFLFRYILASLKERGI